MLLGVVRSTNAFDEWFDRGTSGLANAEVRARIEAGAGGCRCGT
jgi:hypothetical protein